MGLTDFTFYTGFVSDNTFSLDDKIILVFHGETFFKEGFVVEVDKLILHASDAVKFEVTGVLRAVGLFGILLHVDGAQADEAVVIFLGNDESHLSAFHLAVGGRVKLHGDDFVYEGFLDGVVLNEAERGVLEQNVCLCPNEFSEGLDDFRALKIFVCKGCGAAFLLSGLLREGGAGEQQE